jgi:hypothetical protein
MRDGYAGAILTLAQGLYEDLDGVPLIIDNGRFGKGWTGAGEFLAFITRVQERYPGQIRFAVAPDVPGDAAATLAESARYLPVIRAMGIKVALAAQNGLTPAMVPWDDVDIIFLGGVPECLTCGYRRPLADRETKHCPHCGRTLAEWKEGLAATDLVAETVRRGKEAHGGRVNSLQRVLRMLAMGVTTFDGTYVVFGGPKNLAKMLGWFATVERKGVQGVLGGAA